MFDCFHIHVSTLPDPNNIKKVDGALNGYDYDHCHDPDDSDPDYYHDYDDYDRCHDHCHDH